MKINSSYFYILRSPKSSATKKQRILDAFVNDYLEGSMTFKKFMKENEYLLSQLPQFEKVKNLTKSELFMKCSFEKNDFVIYLKQKFREALKKQGKDFRFESAQLEIPVFAKEIAHKAIQKITKDPLKTGNDTENIEYFRKFLGHMQWLESFRKRIDSISNFKDVEYLFHSANAYFKEKSEYFYLNYVDLESSKLKNYDKAKELLAEAMIIFPYSMKLRMAQKKNELASGNGAQIQQLITETYCRFKSEGHERSKRLEIIFQNPPSEVIRFLKNEWVHGERALVQEVLTKAVAINPECYELWLLKGEIEIKLNQLVQATYTFEKAVNSVKSNHGKFHLYMQIAELREKQDDYTKAKEALESAKSIYSHTVQVWIAAIRLEFRFNGKQQAQSVVNQALLKFPDSAEIWAENISIEKNSKEKDVKIIEGLEKFQVNNLKVCLITLAAAKLFFTEVKLHTCKTWLQMTVEISPKFADAWAYYYMLEKCWGTEENVESIMNDFIKDEKSYKADWYGEEWDKFKADIDNWNMSNEELLEKMTKGE